MMVRAGALIAAVCAVLLLLADHAATQSLYSDHPSRTTILALANKPRENTTIVNHERTHTDGRTVLGFVAPWNPRGTKVAEQFRGKLDVVSPAWHTVNVKRDQGSTTFVVEGGSTGKEDDEWQIRMQKEVVRAGQKSLPPVNISPRYVLDRFTAEDLLELLQSDALMEEMAEIISDSVQLHNYDGAVLETGAVWAIEPLVQRIVDRFRRHDKTLTVVLPPLRDDDSEANQQASKITLHAMRTLTPLVDHVVVMTYDYAGRSGIAYSDAYNVKDLPEGSPLDHEGVRTPGPNTPLDYLSLNIERLLASLDSDGMSTEQFFMSSKDNIINDLGRSAPLASSEKLLAGLPLYGYTYAVGWFDNTLLSKESVARVPPVSTLSAKDNDTEAQAAARAKAEQREREQPNIVPLLRFAGEPFKHDELEAQLRSSKALIRLDDRSHEQFFDYVAPLPASMLGSQQGQASASDKVASYWRAFFPSAHTMRRRITTVAEYDGVGLALWDLGQCAEWLLHDL